MNNTEKVLRFAVENDIFTNSKLVVFLDSDPGRFVVWTGGIHFNVYKVEEDRVEILDCFIWDVNGCPDAAAAAIDQYADDRLGMGERQKGAW